ncbi:hypothetical protein L6R52_38235 [Myxococcota bacterium]|nr:hypothetical protein [Myxococcota bacterium]
MQHEIVERRLKVLAAKLIRALVDSGELEEGAVTTSAGPAPYRRLDRRGRALAYVRMRPKKRAVRIDVSNLWMRPVSSRLEVMSSVGAALLVREHRDVPEALAYLRRTVEATERAEMIRGDLRDGARGARADEPLEERGAGRAGEVREALERRVVRG